MKITLSFIKKKKKVFKKGSDQPDPAKYWKIALLVWAVLILGAFAFGYLLFAHVNSAPATLPAAAAPKTVSKDRIDKILDYFSARDEASKEILNSPAPVVDPSK
jgi:hypothetical protein